MKQLISAKIIKDSTNLWGSRLTTLEVIMPRYILAEFNTHRLLSKNSASSRAIPAAKMRKSVEENPFIPYAWQEEHKGMQGTVYLDDLSANDLDSKWIKELSAKELLTQFWGDVDDTGSISEQSALEFSLESFDKLVNHKVTKQLANRLLEPHMYHKVLVSGTEWDNFFALRCPQYIVGNKLGSNEENNVRYFRSWKDLVKYHFDELKANRDVIEELEAYSIVDRLKVNKGQADIHMMFLAEAIWDAFNENKPDFLNVGEYHIPYNEKIDHESLGYHSAPYYQNNPEEEINIVKWELQVSTACCARLSYQTLGDNPELNHEKDLQLYQDFVTASPVHASPFEHPAKSMSRIEYFNHSKSYTTNTITDRIREEEGRGITEYSIVSKVGEPTLYHVIEYGWCRNYRGFIQLRAELGL